MNQPGLFGGFLNALQAHDEAMQEIAADILVDVLGTAMTAAQLELASGSLQQSCPQQSPSFHSCFA
jgi:ATP-dependent protease ClpP protease subunit